MKGTLFISKVFVILFFSFLLISCGSTTEISHWKKGTYDYESDTIHPDFIDVSVSLLPLPPKAKQEIEKPKTFFDLRDSIPNTLLKVLADNTNSADKIIELIKKPLSTVEEEEPKSKSNLNLTSFKARFLFSNIKKFFVHDSLMHDNTRLEFLNTTLHLTTDNIDIYSIDKIENELETIDLGNLERTNDVSFNTKIGALLGSKVSAGSTIDNVYESYNGSSSDSSQNTKSSKSDSASNSSEISKGLSAEASYSNSENIKENLALKNNTIKTGFSFTPKKITVAQRGRPLSGITDNVVLTATLKFEVGNSSNVFLFKNLFLKFDLNNASKVDVERYNVSYIQCNEVKDLKFSFDISYDGALRGVKNLVTGNNIGEFDDRVKFYRIGEDKTSQYEKPTISKFEYCKKVYSYVAEVESNDSIKDYILKIDRFGLVETVNVFEDDNPLLFFGWLNRLLENPTGEKLRTKKFRLFLESLKIDPETKKKRKIYLTKENLSNNEIEELNEIITIDIKEKKARKPVKP